MKYEQLALDAAFLPNAQQLEISIKDSLSKANSIYSRFISVSQNKGFDSVKVQNNIVLRVIYRQNYINIETRQNYIDKFLGYSFKKITNGFCRTTVGSFDEILSLASVIAEISVDMINSQREDRFGCCSRYVECSDARHCTHPDKFFALSCSYKRNLENGKIFYGKNKNI